MRVHPDTTSEATGGDARAPAMLPGWPRVEVLGVTTDPDHDGGRAGPAATCGELAEDLLDLHRDSVTVAVALARPGAGVEEARLRARLRDRCLASRPDPRGRPTRVPTGIDADAFADAWPKAIEGVERREGASEPAAPGPGLDRSRLGTSAQGPARPGRSVAGTRRDTCHGSPGTDSRRVWDSPISVASPPP
jgi:hypothetical protein